MSTQYVPNLTLGYPRSLAKFVPDLGQAQVTPSSHRVWLREAVKE